MAWCLEIPTHQLYTLLLTEHPHHGLVSGVVVSLRPYGSRVIEISGDMPAHRASRNRGASGALPAQVKKQTTRASCASLDRQTSLNLLTREDCRTTPAAGVACGGLRLRRAGLYTRPKRPFQLGCSPSQLPLPPSFFSSSSVLFQ